MKTLFNDLFKCKVTILAVWFFFCNLALIWSENNYNSHFFSDTPHGILGLLVISGLFSVGVVALGILFVKSEYYKKIR